MKINLETLENFCKKNNFIIISDEILTKEGMRKNLVYATENNFIGKRVYPQNMPIIISNIVWNKLDNINNELKKKGKCIVIYDAYRPLQIQKVFWDFFYNKYGYYNENLVANPNKYGSHNLRVNAVDIMISNIDNTPLELPCDFDDFTGKANINYKNCSKEAQYNRNLLIKLAKKYGLIVNEDEWWHFYDESIIKNGINCDYSKSDLIPIDEDKTFLTE